jgi:hypothetical protein
MGERRAAALLAKESADQIDGLGHGTKSLRDSPLRGA